MLTAALLLAIAAAQPPAGVPPRDSQVPAGSATISGRVSASGSALPLPRIVVSLAAADRSRVLQELTDAEGRYRFAGLAAGKYVLSAAPDSHRSTYLPQRYGENAPAAASFEPSAPNIELKADEVRSDADMALSRALAMEGRVLDPWGEPMAGVEVSANRPDGRFVAARPVVTDDLGAYRVYALPPGRYRVCAKPRERFGGAASDGARFVQTCHPAAAVEREAGDVILTSNDASGIDVRVQRVGSYSISGSVMDATGAPVDGAAVGAYSLDDSGVSAYVTSRRGEFVLKGLTPGRYIVKASVGGARPGDPLPPRREMEMGYAWADVVAGDTPGVAVTLSKPVAVAGRVTFDGRPAPRADRLGLVVQMRPSDDRVFRLESRPPFATVDDNLRFELKGLYRLPLAVGVHGLPDGWVLKGVQFEGRDVTHVPIDFSSASSTAALEIVLTNRVARPSVRVTDEQGSPVASYRLISMPADPSRWRLAARPVPGAPSPEGVLALGAMLPGDYLIAALPIYDLSALARDSARIDDLAAVCARVRFEEGDDRTIELRLATLPPAR